jgi:hypothetical protein
MKLLSLLPSQFLEKNHNYSLPQLTKDLISLIFPPFSLLSYFTSSQLAFLFLYLTRIER